MITPLVRLTRKDGSSVYIDPTLVIGIYSYNNNSDKMPEWVTKVVYKDYSWLVNETVDEAAQVVNNARYLVEHPYRGDRKWIL